MIANLVVAHIVGDFYFQTERSCRNKVIEQYRGRDMYIHALIIGILSWVAVWSVDAWWLALAIMLIHFVIDCLKSVVSLKLDVSRIADGGLTHGQNRRWNLALFTLDQLLHIGVIIGLSVLWLNTGKEWTQFDWLQQLTHAHPLRVYTFIGMLIVLKPANILILNILSLCKVSIQERDSTDENFHAGELIGWLERALVLVFVVLSQWTAIGFLVAAKSILRFSEASSGREKAEYVLTGTLLSLTIAIFIGLVVVS